MTDNQDPKLLDHDYDGIQELDNPLPRWWVWLFYLTSIFAVLYCWFFWIGPGLSIDEKFEKSMVVEQQNDTEPAEPVLREFVINADTLANGKMIFDTRCAACHGAEGQGLIGPNLTDNYWIHGGSSAEIYDIIAEGVPAKGMISWKAMLSDQDMQDTTVYIQSLKGSNPANPKAPEGDLVE